MTLYTYALYWGDEVLQMLTSAGGQEQLWLEMAGYQIVFEKQ